MHKLDEEQHHKSFEDEPACNMVRGSGPGDHVGSPFHTAGMMNPVTRLVEGYNDLSHMSLMNVRQTPAEAHTCKQVPKDIVPKEMEEDRHAKA